MRSVTLAVCCTVILLACAGVNQSAENEVPVHSDPPATYELTEVSFLLQRGFCHGECPIYSVEVLGTGTVFYSGERHVRVEGQKTGFVTPEQVLELLSAFYDSGFQDFKSEYLSRRVPRLDADGHVSLVHIVTKGPPRTVVTLRIGEYEKAVSYQAQYAPKGLIDLAGLMDKLVDSGQWIEEESEGHN